MAIIILSLAQYNPSIQYSVFSIQYPGSLRLEDSVTGKQLGAGAAAGPPDPSACQIRTGIALQEVYNGQ